MSRSTRRGAARQFVMDAARSDTDSCIVWPFTTVNGYGRVAWQGRGRQATHVVLELAGEHRPDLTAEHPSGALALHACDNCLCVNPRHLRWGTHLENMREMAQRSTPLNGRRRHLTDEQVLDARRRWLAGETQRALAKEFGVREWILSKAVNRRTYRHVQHQDEIALNFPVSQKRVSA